MSDEREILLAEGPPKLTITVDALLHLYDEQGCELAEAKAKLERAKKCLRDYIAMAAVHPYMDVAEAKAILEELVADALNAAEEKKRKGK